jgi:hypothetical protein
VTNIYYPLPVVSGDVAGKEGVMALEFDVNGQPHYGYIHFDFHQGPDGIIYGFAYETEPGIPIKASPLSPPPQPTDNNLSTKQKLLFGLKPKARPPIQAVPQ